MNEYNLSVIDDFIRELKIYKKSKITINTYRSVLIKMLEDINKSIDLINIDDVRKWINDYSINKKNTTINHRISIIKKFSKYCISEDIIEDEIFKDRWRRKEPLSVPKFFEEQEFAKIQSYIQECNIRDRIIVEFLSSTGVRVSELCSLNVGDIDFINMQAKIKGKGGKERIVTFSTKCWYLLKRYLAENNKNSIVENDELKKTALFNNRYGERISDRGIRKTLAKIGDNLDLHIHPHRFRHNYATEQINKEKAIRIIADELGHYSIKTTKIYARTKYPYLLKIYKKFYSM